MRSGKRNARGAELGVRAHPLTLRCACDASKLLHYALNLRGCAL
jgi:hypothetical protein